MGTANPRSPLGKLMALSMEHFRVTIAYASTNVSQKSAVTNESLANALYTISRTLSIWKTNNMRCVRNWNMFMPLLPDKFFLFFTNESRCNLNSCKMPYLYLRKLLEQWCLQRNDKQLLHSDGMYNYCIFCPRCSEAVSSLRSDCDWVCVRSVSSSSLEPGRIPPTALDNILRRATPPRQVPNGIRWGFCQEKASYLLPFLHPTNNCLRPKHAWAFTV